jgi:RNA polymerase sigma-70 factor (ECF subfamily)
VKRNEGIMPQEPELRVLPGAGGESEPSDEALLTGFAHSDAAASGAFFARFQRRVYGLALTLLGDPRAAEDAAQETFLRAWRHADAFDASRGSVVTWLLTITRNLAIDALRARRAPALDIDEVLERAPIVSAADPADVAILGEDTQRVHRALARLPDPQRRAVVLAGMWGLSAREVAERESIPIGTAKTRIRTGLRRLRIAMARETRQPEEVCA